MEQNREPQNKPMSLSSIIFDKRAQAQNGVKISSSINGVGRTGLVHEKNEPRPPTYTLQQKKTQIG